MPKPAHDESTLPKWAQQTFAELRREIDRLRGVEKSHPVLIGREWFTISGPPFATPDEVRNLWALDRERPFAICSLSHGDVLIVGRSRWSGTPAPLGNGCGGPLGQAAEGGTL